MKKLLAACLLSIISCYVYSQQISGQVYRGSSDTVVANAVVYYSGSMNGGTQTDENGRFQLAARSVQIPIVVSCVGYYSGTVFYDPGKTLIVRLKPKQNVLQEVTIHADDMDRDKEVAIFKEEFLGTSAYALSCTITNIDDIDLRYSKKTGILTARCDKPIIIENKKLGYTVSYYLDVFEKAPKLFSMAGSYTIKDDVLPGDNNFAEVKKNREDVYNGSRMQFIRALWYHSLDRTQFKLYSISHSELTQDDIVKQDTSQLRYVHLGTRIFVVNTDDRKRSGLEQHEKYTFIDKDGYFGPGLVWSGIFGVQRIGDLLPFEYRSGKENLSLSTTGGPSVVNRLAQWDTLAPQEKVHLQTDKPYYSIGEDMWIKAYVVDAKQNYLADKSKVLYIDLVDDHDAVKQTILLPVSNGLARGHLHLSDSLLTAGNYHLCAYTKWMTNFNSAYFFKKDIAIVNALRLGDNVGTGQRTITRDKVKLSTASGKGAEAIANVQFFPEGGHLVNGIRTKVGFKALITNGLGEDVSGYITDDTNEHLAEFNSEHAGMGMFALMPVAGKSYAAVIKHADGTEKRYALPKADESGYVLNINHVGDSLSVRVSASANLTNGLEVSLVAQCNGVVRMVAKTKMDKASSVSYIPLNKFQTGIVQFTLFTPDGKPIAERLVFIDRNDGLTANIGTDKPAYAKREKVTIGLNVADAYQQHVVGSFSVAVTDESKVKADENDETTILSSLLLSSDIKGYIEQPNYYFNPANPDRQKHLDQLLLTQGWRRFSWADLQAGKFPLIKYQPEQSLSVTGSITTLGDKPVPRGKVTLFGNSPQGPMVMDTVADETGHYIFNGLDFADSARIVVRATNAKNSTIVKTIIDKDPNINYQSLFNDNYVVSNTGLENYRLATQAQFQELSKFGLLKNAIALKEVQITAKKNYFADRVIPHSTNLTPGSADHVIKPDKLEHETNLLYAFYNIPGIEIRNGVVWMIQRYSILASKPMTVILDGAIMEPGDINTIPPGDVEGVEILTSGSNRAMYGSTGVSGVIIITTKRGGSTPINNSFNVGHDLRKGYAPVKEFYAPAYDTPAQNTMADLRSTIYWNPDVVTDAQGKASISFYNADGTGTYRVILEGIDTKGGLVRKVFTYVVK